LPRTVIDGYLTSTLAVFQLYLLRTVQIFTLVKTTSTTFETTATI